MAISIGNLVGSNLFNILGAIGISAAARPLQVSRELLFFEMPVLAVFTITMALLLGRSRQVTRKHGALLVAGYVLFMAAVLLRSRL